jgi:hypothetical protein
MIVHEAALTHLLQTNNTDLKLSIYLSTHPSSSSQTVNEDVIRFKNALQEIEANEAYDQVVLGNTMQKLELLLDDTEFWKHRTRGLAVFADGEGYETVSLPYDVAEIQHVGTEYLVGPLVLLQGLGSNYYILDINHSRPRLLECSPSSCTELMLDAMPDSIETVTGNVEYDNELQHQSAGTGTFHGHDDSSALQDDTTKFYKLIVGAVEAYLEGHAELLVLVGVENRVGTLRHLLSYPHVLEAYVEGSGEAMNEQALETATIPLVEQRAAEKRSALVDEFEETNPKLTLVGVDAIQSALAENRIATLLVPAFRETTDTVREGYDTAIIVEVTDTKDMVESLIRSTIAQGGKVVAVAVDAFSDTQPRAVCRF